MRKSLILLVVASLVLASCGWRDSRVNPRNWFGRSKEVAAAPAPEQVNPLIPKSRGVFSKPIRPDTSVPVARVTELRVEQTNSGAIIYASGIAARQGAYGARLLPANEDLIPDEKGERKSL